MGKLYRILIFAALLSVMMLALAACTTGPHAKTKISSVHANSVKKFRTHSLLSAPSEGAEGITIQAAPVAQSATDFGARGPKDSTFH